MQLSIAIASTLLAGVLVLLVPGACIAAVLRIERVVPPPLVPGAALALGLVPLSVVTAATLLLHQPILLAAALLGAFVLLCWGTLARRARDDRRDMRFTRAHARASLRDWLKPLRHLVAGDWLRATPTTALVLAVVAGLLAMYVGFNAWNDSLYHIAQARKLLELDAPTFSNTLQFRDGTAHPGYLLPTWHEAMALVAFVSRQDVVTIAWILPGLVLPVAALALGGLGWALARSRHACAAVVAALVLFVVAALPYSDSIINAMQPGVVALGVLAPLVFAMVLGALWPAPRHDRDDIDPRSVTKASTWVAVVATAGIGLLNVAYLWVLGMGLLGYLLLWLLRSPWRRDVLRRHLVVGGAIALTAGICLALLMPGLTNLDSVGRSAAAELEATNTAQYEGENDANLEALLRGDPDGAYHLRGDYLVQAGGLALLGLVALLIPLAAPRWPGGWYLAGSALLVLGIALSDQVYPRFVDVVTLDQSRRIERVLPTVVGLGMLGVAVAAAARHAWRRGMAMRIAAVLLLAAALAGIALVVDAVDPLGGYAGERIVHPRVLLAILVVLAAGAVVWLAGLVLRLLRRRGPLDPAWPTSLLDARIGLVAVALLLVGAAPATERLELVAADGRLEQVPIDMRGAELRLFSARVADELRELPTGAVVLADPRSRNPYTAMAIAPVYVVSSVPRHTARTPRNRVDERFETAVSFFDGSLTDAERLELLHLADVDAVLVHPSAATDARTQLEGLRGVRMVAEGKNQQLFVIDRERLPSTGTSPTPIVPDR